ncbi:MULTISPECIES: polyprenyl synthetase family protein [Streptomyces]|uniref:Polyprenyl synthetase n=1 Tax=Streptomyces albus TaxID=1888 RepID=A0A8H1L8G7_9ACTN|nr:MULTISPECIES: polyprenyl synthetase family protein [Streptomyces]TGG79665.1 hypothetical protein D8771_23275 [Streptomyces albus]UVN58662.1 polyprenyl synthetase family protein [Streptomyces albus]GHJ21302.1 hypothetical protein TPA0909_29160 [Streptomyces albus]
MSLASEHTARQAAERRIREVYPLVRQYLAGLLDDYRPRHGALRTAVGTLIGQGRSSPHEFALPLLIHGAISGDPEPAVPVAGVHALWWRAANTFDDLVDGDTGGHRLYGTDRGVAMLAALESGYALPLRALEAAELPTPLRRRLAADYLDCWTRATDGQIGDLLNRPQQVDTAQVLEVYRKKSGSVYEMAGTMAARLAHGTGRGQEASGGSGADGDDPSVATWGEFGHLLGVLAQFRNDHDDLCGGPGEDLGNGTATYLLVHLLHSAPAAAREHALALLERTAAARSTRRELAAMMLAPKIVRPYNRFLTELHDRAHALLNTLAPASPFTDCLRARVDAETRLLEPRDTATAASVR